MSNLLIDYAGPSFSFSFDARDFAEKTVTPPPPEIIDVFSSDDSDVVIIASDDTEKAERKRKRKEKRKKEKRKKRHHREKEQINQSSNKSDSSVVNTKPLKDHSTRNPKFIFLKDAGVQPEEAFCLDPNAEVINLTFEVSDEISQNSPVFYYLIDWFTGCLFGEYFDWLIGWLKY